jgi:hypothetical protein
MKNAMSISAAIRSPRFWITIQLLAIIVVGGLFGCWQIQSHADSASYIESSQMSLDQALRHGRTLGYPMLLRMVAVFSPDYAAIPWVHLAMLCPVVFLFDAASRRFGASPWQAFGISSGFMYGTIQLIPLVATILTDFSAMLAAGAAVACLLWITTNPKSFWAWTGLTFFLMASYQIRPAYLFVMPLAICLGLVWGRLYAKWNEKPFFRVRLLLTLTAAAVLPFLAYCSFRWIIVGDFALVSFGGMNNMGLAAEMLDEKLVDQKLSERYRPFAHGILEVRKEKHLKPAFPGGWKIDMRAYEDNYSVNIYEIAKPLATRLFGDNQIIRNREMTKFSREVFLLCKGKFAFWAVQYWPRAVMKLAYRYWILWAAVPTVLLLFLVRRWRCRNNRCPSCQTLEDTPFAPLLSALLWLNILYFGMSIPILILSGTYADSRLIVPTGVFLPSLFALLILRELSLLARLQRANNTLVDT